MRIDDSTMLLLRVVDEHASKQNSDGQARPAANEAAGSEDDSSLGWLHEASKDLKSVSGQMAEQVDQASEKVLRGLRSLKDRAMQKYRETFKKDQDPPQK